MKRHSKALNTVLAVATVTLTLFEMGCAQAISGSIAKNSNASGSLPPGDAGTPPTASADASDSTAAKNLEMTEETGITPQEAAPLTPPRRPNKIHLMTILSDDRQEGVFRTFKMDLNLNAQGDFVSAHFYGPTESGPRRMVNGQPKYVEDQVVTLSDIQGGKPIQEMTAYGYTHSILQIVGPSFDAVHGGNIILRYLKMGAPHPMMDIHSDYGMRLDRVGDTWTISKPSSRGASLTQIKMETMWAGTAQIGVKSITP